LRLFGSGGTPHENEHATHNDQPLSLEKNQLPSPDRYMGKYSIEFLLMERSEAQHERDRAISDQDKAFLERDEALRDKDAALAKKESARRDIIELIREKNAAVFERNAAESALHQLVMPLK
jgi:hypothetical protein